MVEKFVGHVRQLSGLGKNLTSSNFWGKRMPKWEASDKAV